MSVITVYSMNGCAACNAAIKLLKSEDKAFEVIKVDENPSLWEDFKMRGIKSMPQIVIDGVMIGGLRDLHKYIADKKAQDDQA